MTQIHRMAKPGLLSGQRSSIGLLSSSRLQNARAGFPNISPAGTRSFWSHDGRFGKTWRELLVLKDKYLASKPRVEGDVPKQPALKPLQPVLYEEPAVLEHVPEFWVSTVFRYLPWLTSDRWWSQPSHLAIVQCVNCFARRAG